MKAKEILGTISPAYGILKGEGLFGSLAPNLGIIPKAIADRREDKEAEKEQSEAAAQQIAAAQDAAQTAAMKRANALQTGQLSFMKKGGKVKYDEGGEVDMAKMEKTPFKPSKTKGKTVYAKKGGSVSSASKRADGIAQRGKTRGKYI